MLEFFVNQFWSIFWVTASIFFSVNIQVIRVHRLCLLFGVLLICLFVYVWDTRERICRATSNCIQSEHGGIVILNEAQDSCSADATMIKAGSLPSKQQSTFKESISSNFFYKGDNIKKGQRWLSKFTAEVRNMCTTAAVMKRIKNSHALWSYSGLLSFLVFTVFKGFAAVR